MKNRASAGRGFTLIELMIVLAIVGIMIGIGTYSYMSQVRLIKLQNDVREISQTLQLARMQTLSTGTPHGVAFFPDDGRYFIFADCTGDDEYTDPDGNPENNNPKNTAEECAASAYDPRVGREPLRELDDLNQFTDIPGDADYIVFNNLGQTVQGTNLISGPIIVQGPPKNGVINQIMIQVIASGLTEVMPTSQVPE